MSRKYLIISIVTLIIIAGGVGVYYLLGMKEEMGVIPPPTPNPDVQKVETNSGGSEVVVSGEEVTNSGYIDFADGTRMLESDARKKLIEEFTDETSGTKYRAYMARLTIQKKDSEEVDLYLLNGWIGKPESGHHNLSLSPDKTILLFNFVCGNSHCINGIIIDSKEILWNNHDSGDIKWSPDGKNIAIVTNVFERISIKLSNNNIRDLREVMHGRYFENEEYYWESNDTFIYNPHMTTEEKKYYDEYIVNNPQDTKINPGINRFSVRDTVSISFSLSQISEILTKIDENTKKQGEIRKNTTEISEENYLVNYTPNKGVPGGEVVMNIAGSGQVFTVGENILYFDGFSPSKYYLIYTSEKLNNITSKYLRNITTGETIEFYGCSMGLWTIDKKRYICNNSRGGMIVSKYGDLLQTKTVQDEMIFSDFYTDDRYIYGIGYNKFSLKEYRYLKVFDLNTLKEVYSQEIK